MFAERLKRARKASGFSMQDLASKVGISANMIKKYEHGQSMPTSNTLIKLSKALHVKSEYFFRQVQIPELVFEYRKKSSASKKILERIKADAIDQLERWNDLHDVWPQMPIPSPFLPSVDKLDSLDDVEAYAEKVRQEWNLGLQPIQNLTAVLEEHGFIVIMCNCDSQGICDGLEASFDGRPILVCLKHGDGDRQRFTLAHELAHAAFKGRLSDVQDKEEYCHRFAQALLLPKTAIISILGKSRTSLEPAELYFIKMRYGISMRACIHRARNLSIIPEGTKNKLLAMFRKNEWIKKEPGEKYPPESSALFEQLVYRALGEDIISESKAAELLGKSVMSIFQKRCMRDNDAPVINK